MNAFIAQNTPKGVGFMLWYIKQLFPCLYRTTYWQDGKKHFVVWRMWFGRCFAIDDVIVGE